MNVQLHPNGQQTIMGRIRTEIDIAGRKCWTLFDSGARYSYITRAAAAGLTLQQLPQTRKSLLGGAAHDVKEACLVLADVQGHPLEFQASVIDRIGADEGGRTIDVIFGALAMQLWGIKLDLPNERLDFSHFATEFLEF